MKRWLWPLAAFTLLAIGGAVWLAMRPHAEAPKTTAGLHATLETKTGPMVLVPAGSFLFGTDRKPVELPAYYIDQTEVTNGAYAQFCSAVNHPLPAGFPQSRPEYPVVNVSIVDARDFARWAGKRVPNNREWEKAARGTDGRAYPWGDQPDASKANVSTSVVTPANAFPAGASPCGALQMSGNVWELIDEPVQPSAAAIAHFSQLLGRPVTGQEPWVSIRGGSFHESITQAVVYDSASLPATQTSEWIGFRCVRDAAKP